MVGRNLYMSAFLIAVFLTVSEGVGLDMTPWSGRSLLDIFDSLTGTCAQGPQETVTEETMLNNHDWWEQNWGRSDASWPRRGFSDCWANRGTMCALPDQDHVVCLPGSRRGSTIAKGWALDPKGQACKPGVHCLYACEPGYYWTTYNQGETSNYDHANAKPMGHCDGTWNYGTSTHGVLCREDGTLEIPADKPLCALGETYVYAENQLDTHVFLCQTVFPGHEIFLIPTLVRPGESVMITTQPVDYWHGPTYSKPTHGDFYVSFAGADIMEACTWDEFSPSGAALLPYEIGSGVEDNGVVYSTHYFYQQPNSEVPVGSVGYNMDLECESTEDGVCGPVFRNANVVKADVLRRPTQEGSTRVKFIFKKPEIPTQFGDMYYEPSQSHYQDVSTITGISRGGTTTVSTPVYQPADSSFQASGDPYTFSSTDDQAAVEQTTDQSQASATATASSSASATTTVDEGSTATEGSVVDGEDSSFFGYGTYSGTSSRPDFTTDEEDTTQYPSDQHPPDSPDSAAYTSTTANTGRRLKTIRKKSNVYLENTLPTPITICAGDSKRSSHRGISVGPGEKLQLDSETSLKIITKAQNGVSCQNSDVHWLITTGNRSATHTTYSYTQTDAHQGYRLSLRCISEDVDCIPLDARSVTVKSSAASTHEVTFVVKPSARASSQSYAWGHAVHSLVANLFRFPSS